MSPLEKLFGNTTQLTVLENLIKKRGEINYLSGMAEGTGLYHSSVARVIEPLLENNIVIEDQIREITKKTLETLGYKVITANDGKEAIVLYSQNRDKIKLVLMDMMMPVMDGSASICEIHKINPDIKIIAISGLTDKDKLAKVADLTNAFLSKPYTTEKLLKTTHEVLSTK